MPTLDPLLAAPPPIQIHAAAAIGAVLLGPVALLRRSRDIWHKVAGRLWVAAMAVTALSSFWIGEMRLLGPFGPIHLLSVYTLWGLYEGVTHIRAGRIEAHRRTMRAIWFWALGVAGLFTLLPGRRMNAVLFEGFEREGFVAAALVVGTALALHVRAERRARA